MAERSLVFEAINIGVESTPGTEVDGNRRLEAYTMTVNREGPMEMFRPTGWKFSSLVTVGKEHATADIGGVLDYANLTYLLSSLVSYATPAQQGTTTAYLWTFTPDTDGPDTVKTYTVEQGNSGVRAHQFEYGQVTGLSFDFKPTDAMINISGSMIGTQIRDGITPFGTPSVITAVPISPKDAVVKISTTQAGLSGASALTRVLGLEWHFNDKYGPLFAVSTASSFAAVSELAGDLGFKLTLEADSNGMDYLDEAQAGTQLWAEFIFTGAAINGSHNYSLDITMSFQFSSYPAYEEDQDVLAVAYECTAVHDDSWGKAMQITLKNGVTAL